MPELRSKSKQTKLEDLPKVNSDRSKSQRPAKAASSKQSSKPARPQPEEEPEPEKKPQADIATISRKRKSPPTKASSPVAKTPRAKPPPESTQKHDSSNDFIAAQNQTDTAISKDHPTITINRAPVLHLWSACVAHFTHPALEWETCLSIGAAISTLCAVSKGKAIGMISSKEEADDDGPKQKEKAKLAQLEKVHVMSFDLPLKEKLAQVSGKPKHAGEAALRKKFGDQAYEDAKRTFLEAAESWKGEEEALHGKAFGFYEKFRPSVGTGQSSWGRAGVLDLEGVKKITRRTEEGQMSLEEAVK